MSCLNLKRLLSHKKVWKMLKNKLPLKFSRSKPTKKPKHRSIKSSKKVCWPSLSIQPKKFKKQPNFHTTIHHKNLHCSYQRRPPPVFVDQLFVEPDVSVVKELVVSPRNKISENLDRKPESCKEEITSADHDDADDVWESMVVASPQMHGIDQRAEAFIARFRADMRQQEILARRL